ERGRAAVVRRNVLRCLLTLQGGRGAGRRRAEPGRDLRPLCRGLLRMPDAAVPLLADDEPAPLRVVGADGRSDFFLTADHAGRAIPRRLGTLGVSESERARHIAWDIGIAGVTERLSALLDATAVLQVYSRLVIDCNRD